MLHRFSVPAFLASLLVVGAVWVCNALLARQPEGYAELGLYAAADKWRVLIVFAPTYAFAMIVPVLSNLHGEGDGTGFRKVFRANLRLSGGLALLAAAVIAVLATPIMAVYGKSFRGGQVVLMVLAFSAVAEVLKAILGQPLIVAHQMWWRFAFDLLLVALLVGLAWVFIPKWGALGLATSYGLAFATTSLGLFVFLQTRSRSVHSYSMDSRVSLDHSKRASRRGAQNRERRRAYRLTGSRAWSFIALLVVVVSFLFVPSENKYAGALAGAFVFLFVQVFLPSCRPVSGRLLCPWNWALFVFFLQLVLLPSSLLWFGPSRGVLPFLPSDRAINLAMLINVAAFVTFCATYQYFAYHSKVTRHPGKLLQLSGPTRDSLSLPYIAVNGIIGVIGFFLAFGALNKVAEYFSDPSGYLSRLDDASEKLGLAAGLLLRPFLGICVVMLWCRWLERTKSSKTTILTTVVTVLAILAVCFSNSTFNYNRGSVVVPLIAMLGVIVNSPNRVRPKNGCCLLAHSCFWCC